ncbi:serine/threonine-protein kinase ATR [Cryptococcus gattii Ru294]|nr:serine/threonine-protein kinase ATR [Cryptococcus gattii Ru294]
MASAHETLKYDIWWSLLRQCGNLDIRDDSIGFPGICQLLTPVPPRLSCETIKQIVGLGQIKDWEQIAQEISIETGNSVKLDTISAFLQNDVQKSRKRKRRASENLIANLHELLPDLPDPPEGSTISDVLLQNSSSLSAIAHLMPQIVRLVVGEHNRQPGPTSNAFDSKILELWIKVNVFDLSMMNALSSIIEHAPSAAVGAEFQNLEIIYEKIVKGLNAPERPMRVAAGRTLSLLFKAQNAGVDHIIAEKNRQRYIEAASTPLRSSATAETAVLLLGDLGRLSQRESLCLVLQLLLRQLGSYNAPLRSLAYTELVGLAKHHHKTPYTLLSPFLDRISVLLADNIIRSPYMISETMQFIGSTRQNFLHTTLPHILPALVLSRNREALIHVASIVKQRLGRLFMDHTAGILAQVFLHPQQTADSLDFLVDLIRSMTHGYSENEPRITVESLMGSCMVDLMVILVVELGDQDKAVRRAAKLGLSKAMAYQRTGTDLGAFLKPYMLGVISQLNDMLHDVLGKKSVEYKKKIIRSMGVLIKLVGDSMSSFSPQLTIQIMASLQSTLGIKELRHETLNTWAVFTSTLKYADVGPFVGRTTGALVANWPTFDNSAKSIAIRIIDEIADSANDLSQFVEEVVGMDHIDELQRAASLLTAQRKKWPIDVRITKVLDRVASKNIAISLASIRELRLLLLTHQESIQDLVKGDTFNSVAARLMSTLLSIATRDGDCQELRDLSYECLGIIGALDPDRLGFHVESNTLTIASNFADHKESLDFALHLVRDLLVDAFRATNDTKHQNHLAFAIQELLRFCGFSLKVIHPASKIDPSIRQRWQSLPKDQLETLTPLLESRFTLHDVSFRTFSHPIYVTAPTYREWLQRWATDLISKVMSMPDTDRSVSDSKAIFGVFCGVLRNQDVSVAHHILPHLVLNVLLSGVREYRDEICLEIKTVLQDQVQPTSPADRRSLSAQVIFDLMDHLSKWLRLQRVKGSNLDRGERSKVVEGVLSSIETELMAHAALQSKAYARSLRSFEERIIQLRKERKDTAELQTYFERLHQIYAELDEPDGMEGVSAFVISPSLEHQIREHESTGRWTSAQSCWEVRLQQSPDDPTLHVGLLKCLRNLGHYDTLRTHIRGVITRHPDWSLQLAPFAAEAAWIIGDWDTVRQVGPDCPPIGQALLALHEDDDLSSVLTRVRREVGTGITGKGYTPVYEALLQLHLVQEIAMIQDTKKDIQIVSKSKNRHKVVQQHVRQLTASLDSRFYTTSPAFRVREAILSIRRTALGLMNTPSLNPEIGDAWILSSKIARKAGYEQTAYSAILQAREADAPFAFVQEAKLRRAQGSVFKALTDLQNTLAPLATDSKSNENSEDESFRRSRDLAKAVLLLARWANETDRFDQNEIVKRYTQAITLCDTIALRHGVKYIFQTMPRMLTLWLDLGDTKDAKKKKFISKIHSVVGEAAHDLPAYQFYTAFPQIVSRIVHPSTDVSRILRSIMVRVISEYPQQALWPMVGVMKSCQDERRHACLAVFQRATSISTTIRDADIFSSTLLKFTDHKVDGRKREKSIQSHFPYVKSAFPTKMILPLQDALTCSLPTSSDTVKTHNPFPNAPIEIHDVEDRVDIMPSLQRPKKLVFIGSDGKAYPFLCKPHDDLRKDARVMDLNSMINKLLKSASESRRRQLYVRTYAVMPLNEECGLLEWVTNTHGFKGIVETNYGRQNKKIFPTVFHEWFLTSWPEPSAWLSSRLAYSRTLAVMSMIGYILGLGDRHGENILFDGLSGDTVHVDLNCLFEKGKTLEIPERVPFRLTHNMVDALGVTGVEGVFRKAAEITMNILRSNSDSLMSVLEAFVHDPLVEWTSRGRGKSDPRDIRSNADKNLHPIKRKLRGVMNEGTVVSVPNQVETLIKEATSPRNLLTAVQGAMYVGWAPWL